MKRFFGIAWIFLIACGHLFSQTCTIKVDFGNISSPAPWNNLSNANNGSIDNLIDCFGLSTEVSIEVIDSFNGINTAGTTTPNLALGIPSTASGDSFFGNSVLFANQTQPTAAVRIANLDFDKQYTFRIFSSRIATDNRETEFIISGMTTDTFLLEVASNVDNEVVYSVFPSANGEVEIHATTGPNNNNDFGFYYLGALTIEYETDVMIDPSLDLVYPNGDEFLQIDKLVNIEFERTTIIPTVLELSIDGGNNWQLIDTIPAFQNEYAWTVPNSPSEDCLLRISADTLVDQSENTFEISTSTDSCHIVVIGSSTAAGTGASSQDSAWVNRVRKKLYQRDTRHYVTNLARGGYTTYHLLPTGNPLAANVNITIDTARNITKALSLEPKGIIINLPSNDAANNFSVEDQLINFDFMVEAANHQDVVTWVCTTQPRNFSNPNQIQIQEETRDSIFTIYGDFAIDFWNGVADADGFILDDLDSGDGVHLNDTGHRLLTARVLEKEITNVLCSDGTSSTRPVEYIESTTAKIYPNPFSESFKVELANITKGTLQLSLHNTLGQELFLSAKQEINYASQAFEFIPKNLESISSQILFVKIQVNSNGKYFESFVPVYHQ